MQSSILSVSALTADIKRVLEQGFASLQVRGEVSRLIRHRSGHIYFTVKDSGAAISAVIWRSTANRLRCQPGEGGEFIFHGHLSLYEPRGTYQLVIRSLSPAGEGALAAEFERRKREWAARGWFDSARKQPLPRYPAHIGIITSQSAAALEDIYKVLRTRPAWLRLTLAPAQVQGSTAPASITQALSHLIQNRPDLILLARGGGSMEDLWCFNDEKIVQAIVDSPIPIITGIGHEIDITLADLAADLRAATPSNAAELCCPDRHTLAAQVTAAPRLQQLMHTHLVALEQSLATIQLRHQRIATAITDHRHHHLLQLSSALSTHATSDLRQKNQQLTEQHKRLRMQDPQQQLRNRRQRLLQIQTRLQQLPARIQQARKKCQSVALRMHRNTPTLAPKQKALRDTADTLRNHLLLHHHQQQQRWMAAHQTLHALDPRRVLQRGFVMVNREDGSLVTSSQKLPLATRLQLQFADGNCKVKVVQ